MTHAPVTPASADTFGRHDAYKYIHKGLRLAQCQMLAQLGQADFAGEGAANLLTELRVLMAFGAAHIAHEETHVHVHLNAREVSATADLDHQHAEHRLSFARLEALIEQVEIADIRDKAAAGHRLYLAYALFIAHDFAHMNEEETLNNDRLWRLFSDEQIIAMERAIVASMAPEKAMYSMRLMLPALSRDERATFLTAIRPGVPAEAFSAMIEHVARPNLAPADFADLSRRLGLNVSAAA